MILRVHRTLAGQNISHETLSDDVQRDESPDGNDGTQTKHGVCGSSRRVGSCVRSRKRARVSGSRRVKKRRSERDELNYHVKYMSEAVVHILKIMTADSGDTDIDARIEAAVKKELNETNTLINEQKNTVNDLKDILVAMKKHFK